VGTEGVTIGIDLAAQAKDTAACVVDWGHAPAELRLLTLGLDDEALLELIATHQPTKVAIDAPFGWPAPFVSAISSYAAGAPWSATDTRPLRLRATDLNVIEQTGQQPLSVSSDRIAVTAMRCAGLLTSVAGEGSELDGEAAAWSSRSIRLPRCVAGVMTRAATRERNLSSWRSGLSSSRGSPRRRRPGLRSTKTCGPVLPPATICSMPSSARCSLKPRCWGELNQYRSSSASLLGRKDGSTSRNASHWWSSNR
jgi:hypothetical protein